MRRLGVEVRSVDEPEDFEGSRWAVDSAVRSGAREWESAHVPTARATWIEGQMFSPVFSSGADPAATDKSGNTPWDYARSNAALEWTPPYWHLEEERSR